MCVWGVHVLFQVCMTRLGLHGRAQGKAGCMYTTQYVRGWELVAGPEDILIWIFLKQL